MGLTKISGGVIQSDNFSVGVITATSLQIGSATTIHTTGIDLGSGNVTSHNINSTGIITAASFGAINGTTASFSGDVSVGGVLTYDDVTNIDSIGVVTARSGVHFGTAASGTLVIGNSNGIGIGTDNPDTSLRVVESDLGSNVAAQSNDIAVFERNNNGYIKILSPNDKVGGIAFGDTDDSFIGAVRYDHDDNDLNFYVNNAERLRITSDGKIGIGTDNPSAPISIKVGSDGEYVQDFRGTADKQFGFFYDQHSWNQATFRIDEFDSYGTATPRLTIYNGGNIGIGSTLPTQALDVIGRISKTEYEPGEIIERICSVCDGSTHVVKSGSYTMTNVTAVQNGSTSDAVCSGSQISYKCPAGAKRIHYEYWFKWEATERSGISHFFIEVDDADVVPSRRTFANNFSRYSTTYYHHGEGWYCMNWVFECDASSTDTSEGQYDSWASSEQTKVIRTKFREYNGSYEVALHSNYYWDGAGVTSGVNHHPIKPMLIITTTA